MTVLGEHRTQAAQWVCCGGCRGLIYGRRLERNLHVCPDCGRHHPLTAHQRITQLLDPRSVTLLDFAVPVGDPLNFVDTVPYLERVRAAQQSTGLAEAVVCGRGTIQGHQLVIAVLDFRFLGGSLGAAVGELLLRAADVALADRVPLLIVSASGGARMQEGAIALMQMARVIQALRRLDEAGVLTVSLVTDPTFGGVAASFATACDVIIAEPGARLGFAGPRVIKQTIMQDLPDGFQTAEYLRAHGLIDLVLPRAQLRDALARLLNPGGRGPGRTPVSPARSVIRDPAELPSRDPWEAVRRARGLHRPTTLDYVSRVVDDFVELHGDRIGSDDPAIVGGVGLIAGRPVVVIGHQKGHDAHELAARNYGMAGADGHRKVVRLLRLAGKLGRPAVTLVDTPGAYPGVEAEKSGQAVTIAAALAELARLRVPVVTVITGEGGSGGALALALANTVLICSGAVYSVISPEGCASILWRDTSLAATAAAALCMDARSQLRFGVVDGVIPEPDGGVEHDHDGAAELLREAVLGELARLDHLDSEQLVKDRDDRFSRFGVARVDGVAEEPGHE
jgi:acetyl-CoA carboxylase carboxyl transferase beta subunit/acetyl-CoA carboxylase carboxyl transferase alpha subunit